MKPGTGAALAVGLRATVRAVVTEADTATGSGAVAVLATPRLLALAEAAAVAAIAPYLDPESTSVGTAASLEHKRASPLTEELVVEAELTEVNGLRLVFSFIARVWNPDEDLVVGAGSMERLVVNKERFLAGARPAST